METPQLHRMVERRADRTAETRSRIERAALRKFVAQGIEATSIRDIANEAQISLGALYNHFVSKDELAWELFITGWNELANELKRRSESASDLEAGFRAMVRYVFGRFDQDPTWISYVFGARHELLNRVFATGAPDRLRTISGYERYRAEVGVDPYFVFRHMIAEAMQRGEIPRGELELKTALVVGGITQTIDSRIYVRLKGNLADSAPKTAALFVRMLNGKS